MCSKAVENKIVLIAGASGGIGRRVLSRLINSDAIIVAVFNRNELNYLNSEKLTLIKSDLTLPHEWDRLLSYILDKYDRIDIMINCTGVLIPGDFLIHSEEQIKQMLNTNISSVIIGTHKTLKVMQMQGFGHIINLGSVGGILPMPYSSVYSATKFALRGFTHSLAQEIKNTGLLISLISPGPVNTNMLKLEADHKKTAIAFISKVIKPEQVAESIIKIINNPKTEIIIPTHLSFSSRMLSLFPRGLSTLYKMIEMIGIRRKKIYLEHHFKLSVLREELK